ncbi:MAG TPA: hypothetical protein VFI99_04620, partial [Nocardioides sp.]|nr:hypothetical protein [Nocardioides sp.]
MRGRGGSGTGRPDGSRATPHTHAASGHAQPAFGEAQQAFGEARQAFREAQAGFGQTPEDSGQTSGRERGGASLAAATSVGALSAAFAASALRGLRARPPGGRERWTRVNHAGREVTLLEGPAYVSGALPGALMGGPGPAVALAAAGALGALDDLTGDTQKKGLKGHIGALARGEVTTGAVKILGLAATGLVSAALVDRRRRTEGVPTSVLDTLVAGAVIAGSANLVNLLDLRPGRALKATVLAGAHAGVRRPRSIAGAAATGAALGLIGPDLAGTAMLGDTGANAAGALVGTAFVERSGRLGRLAALAGLVGLTLASERVSFTKVIESTPGLRELDALGRSRPVGSGPGPAAAVEPPVEPPTRPSTGLSSEPKAPTGPSTGPSSGLSSEPKAPADPSTGPSTGSSTRQPT